MEPVSFFERIKSLFSIISKSPFFLMVLGIALFTLILLIVNVKTKNKIIKIITAIIYSIIIILFFVKYGSSLLSLGDTVVDKIFTAVYFPNYISYICMMIISVLLIVVVFMDKSMSLFGKYGSILSFSCLLFLFIMSLETTISNNIDITSKSSIYSNDTLVTLIQTSTIIFVIWLILYTISFIVKLLDKKPNVKRTRTNQDIFKKLRIDNSEAFVEFSDPEAMKDTDFEEAINDYKKKKKYKELINLAKNNKK